MNQDQKMHKVGIVVDKDISKEKLVTIIHSMHTWVISSEENDDVAKKYWDEMNPNIEDPYSEGITIFKADDGMSGEEVIDYIIDTVADHHNELAHTPGWSEAHILGCQLTEALEELFVEFGFSRFVKIGDTSFVAKQSTL